MTSRLYGYSGLKAAERLNRIELPIFILDDSHADRIDFLTENPCAVRLGVHEAVHHGLRRGYVRTAENILGAVILWCDADLAHEVNLGAVRTLMRKRNHDFLRADLRHLAQGIVRLRGRQTGIFAGFID